MSENKSATEKATTYAQNSADSAANTLKNAKEAVIGKSEQDKTLGDKAQEKISDAQNKAGNEMEKTGKHMKGQETMGEKISNMGKSAYEGAANMANSAAETLGFKENK